MVLVVGTYILHSHEIRAHYFKHIPPHIVVSTSIAAQYTHSPIVQPPILTTTTINTILQAFQTPRIEIRNILRVLGDHGQIVIGMCSSLTVRKNSTLFLTIAASFPHFDWLWIGGDRLVT